METTTATATGERPPCDPCVHAKVARMMEEAGAIGVGSARAAREALRNNDGDYNGALAEYREYLAACQGAYYEKYGR